MEKAIVCRLKKNGKTFEALTHHGAVEAWREKKLGWDKVCVVDAAFKNSHKGERFSDAELLEAFGTSDITQVLQSICEKGEVQQNAGDRKKMMEDKRKQVVQYLAKYYINPLSKKPHPAVDLENALEAAKVKIDLDTPVDEIVKKNFPKLLEIIKLKRSEMEGRLTVPHAFAGQTQGIIRKYCQIHSEDYTGEGVVLNIGLVPGDFDVFMKEMGSVTKGDFSFDIHGMDAVAAKQDDGGNNNNSKNKNAGNKKQPKKK